MEQHPATNREAWLVSQFEQWFHGLDPESFAAKHEAMAESVHGFYRGSNALYWSDLGNDARLTTYSNVNTVTWLQGDMHAYNFGTFTNSNNVLLYDINDFDECLLADYQLDLWRLAVSVVLIAQENRSQSSDQPPPFSQEDIQTILHHLVSGYLDTIDALSTGAQDPNTPFTTENTSNRLHKLLTKVAEKKSRTSMLEKWTNMENNERVFKSAEESKGKLVDVPEAKETEIRQAFEGYRQRVMEHTQQDAAAFVIKSIRQRRFAGTGSLGRPRYYVLIEGPSQSLADDVILDIKQQQAPTGLGHLSAELQQQNHKQYSNHGERVTHAARALGAPHTFPYLGWLTLSEGEFSVLERSPYKDDLNTAKLDKMSRFEKVATQWGSVLATAHTRAQLSSNAQPFADAVQQTTQNHRDTFIEQICKIALSYSAQVHQDYQVFCNWNP